MPSTSPSTRPRQASRPQRTGKERVSMFTNTEHRTIVTLLAAGKPVWYVAAVTKTRAHDVYAVGASYGYPDRTRLRASVGCGAGLGKDAAWPSAQPAQVR